MTERLNFDSFEQLISAELEHFVAGAIDPRPASEIADAAMRPRGAFARARRGRRSRRVLFLAIAAVLMIPAAYIGASLLRPPDPELINVLPPPASPSPVPTQGEPSPAVAQDLAVFVRRVEGAEPGVSIFAVRPDGGEQLLRHLPDSTVEVEGTVSEWGSVSESGWIALTMDNQGGPWPMILVDLRDLASQPWMIERANSGAIGPRWGPTGQIAAMIDFGSLILADPETRTTSVMSMQGRSLVGGGPSIVWTADGRGIVGSTESGNYEVVPTDGGDPDPELGEISQLSHIYGPGMTTLQICMVGTQCSSGDDGHVEIVEPDDTARTIWRQDGAQRALDASFGSRPGEYWLAVDADGGRQFEIVHVEGEQQETLATVNRDVSWQYVGAPTQAPDKSALVALLSIGDAFGEAAIVVGPSGSQTYHAGRFAGFVDDEALATILADDFSAPTATMPATGVGHQLPTLEELIADEVELNPGRIVLASDSRDAVDGAASVETYRIPTSRYPSAEVYLDCLGPMPVTVTVGGNSATSPCLTPGSYIVYGALGTNDAVLVEASTDTAWRMVAYGMQQNPDWTPPPIPEPSLP